MQGDRLQAAGDPATASAKYAAALAAAQTDDERAEALVKRAQVLRGLNRAGLAEKDLRQAVGLNATSPYRRAAVFQLGGILQATGRQNEAVAVYRDLAEKAKDQPVLAADALLAAARMLVEGNEYLKAREVLESLPPAGVPPPQKQQAAMLLAEVLIGLGDLEAAQKAIAAEGLPKSQAAYLQARLAQSLAAQGKYEEALRACQAALEADPGNQSVWRIRAQIADKQGKAEALVQEVTTQLEADPKNETLAARLAALADWSEDPARALAIYGRLVKLRPEDASVLARAAGLATEAGKLDDALAWYEAAQRLEPDDTNVYFQIGDVQARRGKTAEALDAWKKATSYRAGDVPATARLGQMLAEHSLYEEAAQLYRECRDKAGDPTALAPELAEALSALAKPQEAIREYVTAASQSLPQAQAIVPEAIKVARESALVPQLMEQAKERLAATHAPGLALLLALAEATEGRAEEAIARATEAGLKPDDLLSIGESLEQNGDRDGAARMYAAVVARPGVSVGLRLENALRAAQIDVAAGRVTDGAAVLRLATATPGGPPQLRDRASLMLADLTLRTGGDPDEASSLFAALAKQSRLPDVAREARWRLADAEFAAGHFDAATAMYQQLAQGAPAVEPVPPPPPPFGGAVRVVPGRLPARSIPAEDSRMTPAYAAEQIAEGAFRSGQFDRAKALFAEVAEKYPESIYANDALARRVLIMTDFAQPRPAADTYRQALIEGAGPHWEAALAKLRDLAALGAQEPLSDEAAVLTADLLASHGRAAEAAAQYRAAARDFPASLLAPEALLKAAQLAQSLGDDAQAKQDLEALLKAFPKSPMAETAALRLDDLARQGGSRRTPSQ